MRAPLAVSQLLERGALGPPTTTAGRALGAAWGRALGRSLERELLVPPGLDVVAVGGATLGGSGKTPLAIACALALAEAHPGARVALVGHAYRARPGRARVVRPDDDLVEVGDEALVAAQAFEEVAGVPPARLHVVVAPRRADALAFAARSADIVVLDGVTQTAPVRASLALLAVDAREPWGAAAAVPPWGDLRAPVASLVGAVDRVVAVGDGAPPLPRGFARAPVRSRGATLGRTRLGWDDLARLRVGLLCALARPERVLRGLAERGVLPVAVIRGPDHGPLPRHATAPASGPVDVWLATPKCALHALHALRRGRLALAAPLATLEHAVALPGHLIGALTAVGRGNTLETSRNVSQKATGAPPERGDGPGVEVEASTRERVRGENSSHSHRAEAPRERRWRPEG